MSSDEIMKVAIDILIKQGYHTPTIIMESTRAGGFILLEEYPAKSDERINFMFTTGRKAIREHSIGILKQVFLVSEAWMGKLISPHALATRNYVRPSLDPNRMEVLTVTCYNTVTRENTISISEILRNDREEIVEINKVNVGDGKGESELLPAFVAGYTSGM